jgi:hypothetical protein
MPDGHKIKTLALIALVIWGPENADVDNALFKVEPHDLSETGSA